MKQRVEFAYWDKQEVLFEEPNAFELRPEKGYAWLQKLCIWFLRKLKCHAMTSRFEFRRVSFKPQDFMENLYRQRSELFDLYDKRGVMLLVGAEDFREMMNDPGVIRQEFQFTGEYRNGPTFRGMRIKVVPWMSGILVVPEDLC